MIQRCAQGAEEDAKQPQHAVENDTSMKKSILTLALGGLMGMAAVGLFAFQPDAATTAVPTPEAEPVAATAPAAPKSGDILVVRNSIGAAAWSRILTTYPDGKTEVIKLSNFDPQNFVNNNEMLPSI